MVPLNLSMIPSKPLNPQLNITYKKFHLKTISNDVDSLIDNSYKSA